MSSSLHSPAYLRDGPFILQHGLAVVHRDGRLGLLTSHGCLLQKKLAAQFWERSQNWTAGMISRLRERTLD
jgi:hypothetical protein